MLPQIDWTISIPNVATVAAICGAALFKAHGAIIRSQLVQEQHGQDIKASREDTRMAREEAQKMREDLRAHTSREEVWQRDTDRRVEATLGELRSLQQVVSSMHGREDRR